MPSFYYTYGISPQQPYLGGWTKITAPDRATADKIFRTYHPSLPGHGITLNCAFVYNEDEFVNTEMYKNGNFGVGCLEELTFSIETDKSLTENYLIDDELTLTRTPEIITDVVMFSVHINESTFNKLMKRTSPIVDMVMPFANVNHMIIGFNTNGEIITAQIYYDDHRSYTSIDIYRNEAAYIAKQLVMKTGKWKKSHPDDDLDIDTIDDTLTKYWGG